MSVSKPSMSQQSSKLSQILKLKDKGLSVRQIAKLVGISKSSVNRLINLTNKNESTQRDIVRGNSHIERAGYRYILFEDKTSKMPFLVRMVMERSFSDKHGISREVANEWGIGSHVYLREDLYEYITNALSARR